MCVVGRRMNGRATPRLHCHTALLPKVYNCGRGGHRRRRVNERLSSGTQTRALPQRWMTSGLFAWHACILSGYAVKLIRRERAPTSHRAHTQRVSRGTLWEGGRVRYIEQACFRNDIINLNCRSKGRAGASQAWLKGDTDAIWQTLRCEH